jgi:hypothetical protein
VALACLVPLLAGASGVWRGVALLHGSGLGELDNHFRYLSGLLLGIGMCFAFSIAHIERHGSRFRLLTLVVVIGGLGRLAGFVLAGVPDAGMVAALAMELAVTPGLCLWQWRVARRLAA